MKNLALKLYCLAIVILSTRSAAIDFLSGINFYERFHDPKAHLRLKRNQTTAHRIERHGYPVEHHKVITKDGYILGLFRIPYSHKLKNKDAKRPVVFLQHALFSSSDAWILTGPNDGLAFLLADAGYDVWMGNARGNTYSRTHIEHSTKHPYFWRFSWHEIGVYDLPAMIDYALKTNGQNQKSLHYIGHSQGTTTLFVLLSKHPEYNKKIKTAQMFAPVVFMNHLSNRIVRSLAPYLGYDNIYSRLFSSQEYLPYNDFYLLLFLNICSPQAKTHLLCSNHVIDNTESRINTTCIPDMLATHPSGISTNQILHYLQEQQSGHFREYDHGVKRNLKIYNSEQPPDYAVNLITAELHLWYADNDDMVAVEDVLRLSAKLPNKVLHHIEDPLWGHVDYAAAWHVREQLYKPLLAIMKANELNNKYNYEL